MPYATVNGVRLYHEEQGTGDPILCIHGTSSSAMIWGPVLRQLTPLGRVIAYDRRGCTRSERPEPYVTSVAQHADDAAALLEALDAAPAVVIGRSYGGETALSLALRHPATVRALVLLEAAVLSLDPEARRWADELHQRLLAVAADAPESVGRVFMEGVVGPAAWRSFPEPIQRMITDNGPAILAEFAGGILDTDAKELGKIDVPTLLVAGSDSPPAFRRVTDLMADAIPGARVELVGGGHLVSPAEPAVLAFLRELTV
ncbi:MAG: alpha/beta fold hydrolase [Actinomycetota bacterium]